MNHQAMEWRLLAESPVQEHGVPRKVVPWVRVGGSNFLGKKQRWEKVIVMVKVPFKKEALKNWVVFVFERYFSIDVLIFCP